MTHNIIKTENYLLIVSDEIPTTWYYDTYLNQVRHTGGAEYGESSISKKVIGHLPVNNSPVLEGVPLLPPLEDEVEKLAEQEIPYIMDTLRWGFKKGYNKAKEKYNKNLIDWIDNISNSIFAFQASEIELKMLEQFKNKVQSLQQPKMPVAFECEWTTKQMPEFHQDEPKTTTNLQGQTVLVGKYIY